MPSRFPLRRRARRFAFWLTLAVGAALSLGGFRLFRQWEREALAAEFARRCQIAASLVELSLRAHENALHSMRNLFTYSDEVLPEEFAGAASDLIARHPAIRRIEWAVRVPADERATFEAAQRTANNPEFSIHDWEPTGTTVTPSPARPEHFVVVFSHPHDASTRFVIGYDLAGATALPNLRLSEKLDDLVVSERRPLEPGGWSFVLNLPVRAPALGPGPRSALRGYLLAFGRTRDLVEAANRQFGLPDGDLIIVDANAPAGSRISYFHTAAGGPEPTEEAMRNAPHAQVIPVAFANRTWEIIVRPTPAWFSHRRSLAPLGVLGLGLISSLLLAFYLRGTFRHTELVEQEVLARTSELRHTKALLEEDIRRRQQAENALHLSEVRLQAIIDGSSSLIFVKDLEGRYLLVNRAYQTELLPPGTQLEGRTDFDVFPEADARRFREMDQAALASDTPLVFEESVPLAAGGERIYLTQKFPLRDAEGRIYAVCGLSSDITATRASEQERLRLQQQLQESRRLEALAMLAGGIAHDFNNLLTAILGHASLLSLQIDRASGQQSALEQIQQAARRAADLCSQMLAYAGKGVVAFGPVDLSHLIRETAALLEISLRHQASLRLELAPDLPAVEADATQLRQIVMNLVINAAESLGPRTDGVITVASSLHTPTADFFRGAVQSPALPGGRYVGLAVSDNGCGMSPDTLRRIFEPFFTTKFSGRGLGLSAVLGIVQRHRGALFVESREGHGTTFRLYLPALEHPAAPPPPAPQRPAATRLQGTVLVVDDEFHVRHTAVLTLRRLGLDVLEACDGSEALALCAEHATTIDLVLLDLTMPRLSGEETLRRMREAGFTRPVILMSGYNDAGTMRGFQQLGAAGFLAKPFEIAQFAGLIAPTSAPPPPEPPRLRCFLSWRFIKRIA